jgi:hypothetical protein
MRPQELECVVLKRDLPEFRLVAGNIGTVVLVYPQDALEVEFVDREGDTVALLTILDRDVRVATREDFEEQVEIEPLPLGVEAPIADATGHIKVPPRSNS